MGDIREFWLAVIMYLSGAIAVYALTAMMPSQLSPVKRVALILVGGFVLGTALVFVLAGLMKTCSRRKR